MEGFWKSFLIVLGVILAIALIFVGIVGLRTDETKALFGLTGLYSGLLEREDVAAIRRVLTKGSIEFDMTEDETDYEGKFYFSKDGIYGENITISQGKNSIEGNVFLGDDRLYIENDSILDGAVGVYRGSAESGFKKSIFAPDKSEEYSLDEFRYNWLMASAKSFDAGYGTSEMSNDTFQLFYNMFVEVWDIFCENAEIKSEVKEVKTGGKRVNAREMVFTFDSDALYDLLEDLYDYLEDNEALEDYMDKYEGCFGRTGNVYYDSFYFIDMPPDIVQMVLEEYKKELDHMRKALKENDEDLVVTIVNSRFFGSIYQLSVEYGDEQLFSLDFGEESLVGTDKITLEFFGITTEYAVKRNDEKSLEIEFTSDDETIFSLKHNKSKETFELTLEDEVFAGDMSISKGTIIVEVKTYTYTTYEYDSYFEEYNDVEVTEDIDLTLTIKEKDKMPTLLEDFDDFFDTKEKTVKKWEEEMESIFR